MDRRANGWARVKRMLVALRELRRRSRRSTEVKSSYAPTAIRIVVDHLQSVASV